MTKLNVFSGVLILCSCAFLLDAGENLYRNPELETVTRGKRSSINGHWSDGSFSVGKDYNGNPSVTLITGAVKDGGFNASLCQSWETLAPGWYTLRVKCRVIEPVDNIILYVRKTPANAAKAVFAGRTFRRQEVKFTGWKQLETDFEVKPGDKKFTIGFNIYGTKTPGKAQFAEPELLSIRKKHYPNPAYQHVRTKKGFWIKNHWSRGKISFEKGYKDQPAAALRAVKAPGWNGYDAFIGTEGLLLAPGKYIFNIWCKPGKDVRQIYLLATKRVAGQKKAVRVLKKYTASDMPKVGEWRQLVHVLDVKPGDTRCTFGYGFIGKNNSLVTFSAPELILDAEDEE